MLPPYFPCAPRWVEYGLSLSVPKALWETIRLSVATRDHGTLTPVDFIHSLRSLEGTAHGGLIPLQRSACDYAEVSLSLCICHRLPQVAILILTYPLYRSLRQGGHGEVEVNLARYFNADTRNVPFGPVLNCESEEGRMNSSFTSTEQRGLFCRGVFGRFLKMS